MLCYATGLSVTVDVACRSVTGVKDGFPISSKLSSGALIGCQLVWDRVMLEEYRPWKNKYEKVSVERKKGRIPA